LPSGILLRWGQVTGNQLVTVTFSTGVGVAPAFNEVFSIQLSPIDPTTGDVDFAVRLIDFSNTQFRFMVTKRTTFAVETTNRTVEFLAIGY